MAKVPGLMFVLLVLAGLVICQTPVIAQPSDTTQETKTSQTPDIQGAGSPDQDKVSGSPANTSSTKPETNQNTETKVTVPITVSGSPALTSSTQHQTNPTTQTGGAVNTSVSGLPTLTPSTQHQTNVTISDTDEGAGKENPNADIQGAGSPDQDKVSGSPANTSSTKPETNQNTETKDIQGAGSPDQDKVSGSPANTSSTKPETNQNTETKVTVPITVSGSPALTSSTQHQTNPTTQTGGAVNTSVSGLPTLTPSTQHQTNVTTKTGDIQGAGSPDQDKVSGSPANTSSTKPETNQNTETKVTVPITVSGSPALTSSTQHQTNPTTQTGGAVNTSVSGLPTLTPSTQHQTNTTIQKEGAVNTSVSGLPTLTPSTQHQTNVTTKTGVTVPITVSGSPALTSSTQHQTNPTTQTGGAVNTSVSGLPTLTPSTQHQTNTTIQKEGAVNTSVSGLPTLTPSTQHQTNVTTKTGVVITVPVSPASTNSSQHQTNTNITTEDNSTTILHSSTQQQPISSTAMATTVSNTSDLHSTTQQPISSTAMATTDNQTQSTSVPLTSSPTDTTSPTLTNNATTVKPLPCKYNYSFNDEWKVGFNINDVKGIYNITLNNVMLDNTRTIPVQREMKKYQISFTSLKPCQKYAVSFTPSCTPSKEKYSHLETRTLVDSDVSFTLKNDQVCFKTVWNLTFEKECITVTKDNSCSNSKLNFKEDVCNKTYVPFQLPPVKPVFNITNKFPNEFNWINKPKQCPNNLTYSCNDTIVKASELKPFIDYTCKGTYNFGNRPITSNLTKVKIECYIGNVTIVEKTASSIKARWDLSSTNCPNITKDITLEASCTNNTSKKVKMNCSGDYCEIKDLEAFTTYNCTFNAKYNYRKFLTVPKIERTLSTKPELNCNSPELTSHNSYKITCSIISWHGDRGEVKAELFIDGQGKNVKQAILTLTESKYSYEFKDLYYLTHYKVQVTAINGNGNKTEREFVHFDTKYNDKAVLGFLSFLIIVTSIALLFVLYKIYLLKREKSSRNEQEMDDLLPSNALLRVEPINADDLLDAYKKKRADEGRLFMEEFQSIPRIFSNFSVREAKKSENHPKNRYVDILPYDYNRVCLSHGGTDDYINGSFIEGYKETNKYIAAQGPKEETIGDFWTMIWEQKTSIIVMVTRCEEGNKNKCAQYWPSMERETEIFDDLVVKIKGEEKCPDYIIRHLTLMNRKEKSAEREVTHIQFTSWPDHGVPSDPGLLLKLRRRVNSFKNFFSGPIVIHCSAGVGRTGTYICIDAMIESLEAEGRVDIYGYVVKLRRQRCLMVQVEAQYVLIHTALIEYSQFGETEMALSSFHSEVSTLRQKEGSEPSLMELEFQKLPKFKTYRSANTARTEENKNKNRSSIIPYDFNRVPIKVDDEVSHDSDADDEQDYSSDEEDEVPTKYINASYLDGYWMPSSFIVAQGPMEDTVADFLHMLYQKQVQTVFMLSNCTENDKEFCTQYWHDEKKTFEEMVVEVKETENTPTYIRRCLEIQHTKRKDSHTLQQYQFLKWAGQELPDNPLDLVDMMRSVRQSGDNNNKNKNLPILAHCNDGSSRSGIFCALWKLLDSADTEKLVDIFQVAKDMRKARMGMLTSFEQYNFLYAALEVAYPVQNGEVKKPSEAPADTVQVINESTALISPSTGTDTEESTKEGTGSVSPEEGATEASTEPEKSLSESTPNGPTATAEAESV
ncbi:receptor-type tyrosine-protein phosphatase C isoform X12 [Tachysurus fulvidraco]|uniref:receptor-type tyrosine-protein phosphatase C isoform X12 n=1 Tax=Tachysurus fulvidraco TaxID=1234273 RepID=UPI001FEF7A61|nr:receptor-type tyrosine-protein phosphatase C isoform X12 [Tachysurus fulvidraco]